MMRSRFLMISGVVAVGMTAPLPFATASPAVAGEPAARGLVFPAFCDESWVDSQRVVEIFGELVRSEDTKTVFKALIEQLIIENRETKSRDEILAMIEAEKKAFALALRKKAFDQARQEKPLRCLKLRHRAATIPGDEAGTGAWIQAKD